MDQFNYLAVLISIILGLGITQVLSAFGRWIEQRKVFHAYGPAICWAAMLLLIHVQTWWSMFGLRYVTDWTFLKFSVVLLQPVVLYLMTAVALPSAAHPRIDLREIYFAQRRWFFGLLMLLLAVSIAKELVLVGALPAPLNLAFHLLLMTLAAVGVATPNARFHTFVAYSSVFTIGVYIWLLFARLQ